MKLIWQDKNFLNFEYVPSLFVEFEKEFYRNLGVIIGVLSHLHEDNLEDLKIELNTPSLN
jgi:Domain of unknown function (DUF4172)